MEQLQSQSAKPKLSLSVNPTYYCNFRCEFCYLTPEQLGDKTRLSLTRLFERVDEVMEHYDIEMVDLYGGETLLLPKEYLDAMKFEFHRRGIEDLNLITNLSVNNPVMNDVDWMMSVSYDFEAREKHELVFNQMLKMEREFNILMLASPELMEKDVDGIIDTLNLLAHLHSVEIKPYSSNQANDLDADFVDFEEFVKKFLERQDKMRFDFTNAKQIQQSLAGERNAFSDDHLYITPTGDLAVLEFDDQDREYFLSLADVDAYRDWCALEKNRVMNTTCASCEYLGRCLSEHLRSVMDTDRSCNGFIGLLRWADS